MQIAYLDGDRLRRALIVGARRLGESAAQLNAINVFPVPDGDTGTNMAGTARTMVLGLREPGPSAIGHAIKAAADSALIGARGNSGVILAQFLHGLAEELKNEIRISTRRFGEALIVAARHTYRALSTPREGTILTVLKDWAEAAHRLAQRTDDFIVLMTESLEEANASLARTTELLPELKKAGVVDAGAQGVVHILEGILGFIHRGRLRDLKNALPAGLSEEESFSGGAVAEALSDGRGSFRYCTECILTGSGLDLAAARSALAALGDSVVVGGSESMAKVHLHTDRPGAAFALLSAFGLAEAHKVDDMELQRRLASTPTRPCAVLIDSACDLPDDISLDLAVEHVPVQVDIGGRPHLDRDGLSAAEFYEMIRADPDLPIATSQPTPAAFARKLDLLLGHAAEVVYIGIAGALSGTLEGGRRAAAASRHADRIRVVDSLSISAGTALVARRAAEAAAAGASAAEVAALAERCARGVRLLVAVPDLSGLIRSGRLGGVKGLAARSLGLRPIIAFEGDGKAKSVGLYFGAKNGVKALVGALGKALAQGGRRSAGPIEIMVAHADAAEEAARLAAAVAERFDLGREPVITTATPALSAHAGIGALALAFLPAIA